MEKNYRSPRLRATETDVLPDLVGNTVSPVTRAPGIFLRLTPGSRLGLHAVARVAGWKPIPLSSIPPDNLDCLQRPKIFQHHFDRRGPVDRRDRIADILNVSFAVGEV